MFQKVNQRFSKLMLCVLCSFLLCTALSAGAVEPPAPCIPASNPYLFILLDTSGSMNWAPPCSQADIDAGICSRLCTGAECFVPLRADSPDSKLFQIKAGLFDALSSMEAESIQFGFATFNQDALTARSKHWLYEAASHGVNVPGGGPFPVAGSREVVGPTWSCGSGTGNDGVGCTAANPADLSDAWELARIRELAKGGASLSSTVTFFIRNSGLTHRMQYTPVPGGSLGSPISFQVRAERCLNAQCTSLGSPTLATVTFNPVSEFLAWQNGAIRTELVGYFSAAVSDTSASNTCASWDPNTDSVADLFNNYSLRWPTTTDPRGSLFDQGDVLPIDWLTSHRQDIQLRLAPNLFFDPLAAPDFRTSPHLQDTVLGGESFLRLRDENARPLIANGSTPHGGALRSFRVWYKGCVGGSCPPGSGWAEHAAVQDPEFSCRYTSVVLITDGPETCGNISPCAEAANLLSQFGIRTFVVAYGMDLPVPASMSCITQYGHTEMQFPRNPSELSQALREIFVEATQSPF